ncbi:MAG: alpha/beta fold hydrolase [Gammaproteobacteria bacterium]
MKFTWFHLMPWPNLPDDFRSSNRSVWVDIPSSLYDPEQGHHLYHEYLDQLEYADALGFDAIAVNEHHQNGYGLMPHASVQRFADCRHLVPYEQPEAFVAAVSDFLG